MRGVTAVLLKELRTLLRSPKAFWVLMLVLVAASGFFLLVWADEGGRATMQSRGQLARMLYMALSGLQICAFSLVSVIMTTTCVTIERERKTLDLLYCSGLSRFSLLMGKWFSAIAYQLILLICMLPILSLVFLLGGVGLDEYLITALMSAMCILTYSMFGLALSCVSKRSAKTLFVGIVLLLLLNLGIPFMGAIAEEVLGLIEIERRGRPTGLGHLIFGMSSVLTWFSIVVESNYRTGIGFAGFVADPSIQIHATIQFALFAFSGLIAWRGLARRESGKGDSAKPTIVDHALLRRRRRRWPFYLIDPLRKAQEIDDSQNPVLVKEKRSSAMAKPQTLIRVAYVGMALSGFLLFLAFERAEDTVRYLSMFALGFILALGPALVATAVSREREERTMDLLQTTLLTPRRVLWGKLMVAFRLFMAMAVGVMTVPLIVNLIFRSDPLAMAKALALTLPTLMAFSFLYACVGLYISSRCSKNTTAVVLSYVVIALLLLSPLILVLLGEGVFHEWLGWREMGRLFERGLVPAVGPMLCPFYYFAADRFRENFFHARDHWGIVSLHTLLVLSIAAVFFRRSVHHYRRRL